jgi:hypothetical protein
MKTTIIQGNKVKTLKNCRALAFTGHTNIEKCYNIEQIPEIYNEEVYNSCYGDIKSYIDSYIKKHQNEKIIIITGMARGVDEVAGLVAMDLGLDIICSVPHSIEWHKNRETIPGRGRAQAIYYDKFLEYPKASWVEIKKSYSGGHKFANFARNCFMVDIATDVVSFKQYDSSGTDHCIKYAKKEGKYIGNIQASKGGDQW